MYRCFQDNVAEYLTTRDIVSAAAVAPLEMARQFNDKPQDADIVFLHEHSDVLTVGGALLQLGRNIEAWLPHVGPDGLLCGDNYDAEKHPEIVDLLIETFGEFLVPHPTSDFWLVNAKSFLDARAKAAQEYREAKERDVDKDDFAHFAEEEDRLDAAGDATPDLQPPLSHADRSLPVPASDHSLSA